MQKGVMATYKHVNSHDTHIHTYTHAQLAGRRNQCCERALNPLSYFNSNAHGNPCEKTHVADGGGGAAATAAAPAK